MKVNVLTVDEREVVRLGVGQMLLQTTSCVCVGTCTTPVEALNHIRDDPGAADVVLLGLQTGLNHRGDLCGLLDLGLRIVLFRITSDPYIDLNPIMKRVAGIIEPTSSARDLEEALVAARHSEEAPRHRRGPLRPGCDYPHGSSRFFFCTHRGSQPRGWPQSPACHLIPCGTISTASG